MTVARLMTGIRIVCTILVGTYMVEDNYIVFWKKALHFGTMHVQPASFLAT